MCNLGDFYLLLWYLDIVEDARIEAMENDIYIYIYIERERERERERDHWSTKELAISGGDFQ